MIEILTDEMLTSYSVGPHDIEWEEKALDGYGKIFLHLGSAVTAIKKNDSAIKEITFTP